MRTNIPLRERVAGRVILAMLGLIGIAIVWKGNSYDPGKFALRPEALSSTAKDVAGKASTIRAGAVEQSGSAEDTGYEPEAVDQYPVPSSAPPIDRPLTVAVADLEPLSKTEFYTSETLYEKINGRAPAYIEFEFQNLRARSFGIRGKEWSFIDVLEFEMSSPVTAYGIFSAEREDGGEALDFGDDGYRSEMGYFLRQGPRYVQIIASDKNPETLRLAEAVARDRVRALPSENKGLEAMQQLPREGMVKGTIEFVQSNAFGQAALHDVYQARYNFRGTEVIFFVMIANPVEVKKAWEAYRNFAGRYGEVSDSPNLNGARLFVAELFGNWLAVYTRDDQIGGVVEAPSEEASRGFVTNFLNRE